MTITTNAVTLLLTALQLSVLFYVIIILIRVIMGRW